MSLSIAFYKTCKCYGIVKRFIVKNKMFRNNLVTQYRLYAKNLKSVKEKVVNSNYRQVLQDAASVMENNISEKIAACTSIASKKLNHNQTSKGPPVNRVLCNQHLEELGKYIKKAQSKYNTQVLNRKLVKLKSAASEKFQETFSKNRIGVYGAVGVAASSESLKVTETPIAQAVPIIEPIPEPPPIPDSDVLAETVNQLNALGEPTFASLGLGGWTPVGIVQSSLEYLHVVLGIPWWEAIAIGTIIIRFCMFPLVVMAQRNAAKMNNYLPQLQAIQVRMTEARQSGNQIDVAKYSQEMMIFMKEKDLNPLKNMIVPLAQMPIFVSFFMGLRKMANLPVDSLREGGMFWFTDLTVPDQYFALPIITSLTLWTTIELGTDSAKLSSQNLQVMKYVLRAMPVVILPFTVNFPGAILCYWVASNFISLAQVGFLRIPSVRDYFKIEPLIKHDPTKLPVKNKGFVGGMKDTWTNVKITRELDERRRYDELQFQRAGRGPVVKTYKYDPTKQINNNPNTINAKKR